MPSRTNRATWEARMRFCTWASLVSNFASSLASSWLSAFFELAEPGVEVFPGHQLAADLVPVRGQGVGKPLRLLVAEHVAFAEVSGNLEGVQHDSSSPAQKPTLAQFNLHSEAWVRSVTAILGEGIPGGARRRMVLARILSSGGNYRRNPTRFGSTRARIPVARSPRDRDTGAGIPNQGTGMGLGIRKLATGHHPDNRVGSQTFSDSLRGEPLGFQEAMTELRRDTIESILRTARKPGEQVVKVAAVVDNKPPAAKIKGYATFQRFLKGSGIAELEIKLGFAKGALANGAYIYTVDALSLNLSNVVPEGYTDWSDGITPANCTRSRRSTP